MYARGSHKFLTTQAALQSIVHRMERQPDYRPRGYPDGRPGLEQAREHLEDCRELLQDYKGEGEG